jgi:hypothetical protein
MALLHPKFPKARPLRNNSKKYFRPKYFWPFKDILVQEIDPWCITKSVLFGLFDSAHTFYLRGQLYVVKVIYQSSDVILSKQMTDPPLPRPLELSYL